jgi:Polysaccharide lyase
VAGVPRPERMPGVLLARAGRRGWRLVAAVGLGALAVAAGGAGPSPSGPVPPGSGSTALASRVALADDLDGRLGPIWQLQRVRPDALTFVADPTGARRRVLAVTLRAGDMADAGGRTERAELSEANDVHLPTGTPVWYGFSLYVPPDFPIVDRRLVVGQWKQDCGNCAADHSPAIANRYRGGVFSITIDHAGGRRTLFEERTDMRGRWRHLAYHIMLTPSHDGVLQAWLDGRQVVDYRGPLGFEDDRDSVYFKLGLYRDTFDQPMTLYFARFRRGSSRAEVDPATPGALADD